MKLPIESAKQTARSAIAGCPELRTQTRKVRLIAADSTLHRTRRASALGVDRERAYHRLLSVTVEAIDRERAALDWTKKSRPRTLDDFAAGAVAKLEQLDFGSVIVEHRRVA